MARSIPLATVLVASIACLAALVGCESTGRPTSTKSEAKKSPAKWTAVDEDDLGRGAFDAEGDPMTAEGMALAHELAATPMPGGPDGAGMPEVAPAPPPVMLGVRMRPIDPVLATHLGVDPRHAAVLEDVAEELNGHAGGLRDHDVIVGVEGRPQASASEIRRVLRSKKPGESVRFTVVRGGARSDVTVVLEAFDPAQLMAATPARIGG